MIKKQELHHDEIMGNMKINSYDSSTLDSSIYFIDRQVLTMTFKSGATYEYKDVDHQTYSEFILAESHGSAFNKLIKSKFTAKKIENE
jgi:hypothetical protein